MRRYLVPIAFALTVAACSGEAGNSASPSDAPPAAATATPEPTFSSPALSAPVGPTMSKAELGEKVCFFTPAEIEQALGFAVSAGKPDTTFLERSGAATCAYDGKENSLRLNAYWIDPSLVAGARQGMTMLSGGGQTEQLPGDPDAAYLHDQQDNGTSLHYLRGNVRVQLHATSGMVPFATMKPKLLTLRRVP